MRSTLKNVRRCIEYSSVEEALGFFAQIGPFSRALREAPPEGHPKLYSAMTKALTLRANPDGKVEFEAVARLVVARG